MSDAERNLDATRDLVRKNILTADLTRDGDMHREDVPRWHTKTLNKSACQKNKTAMERECRIASNRSTTNVCFVNVCTALATKPNASVPNRVNMGLGNVNANDVKDT